MKKTYFTIGFFALLLFVCDQFLKEAAQAYLENPIYLTNWLSFRYEQNFGIAWSIPVPRMLLLTLNIVLLGALPIFFSKSLDLHSKKAQIFLSFLVGGAVGNLFDRLFRGYVIDYLSIGTFPVFNLADALLCLGIFLIVLFYDKIKRN